MMLFTGLKNNKAVGNNEILSEIYKFASELLHADHDVNIPFLLYAHW